MELNKITFYLVPPLYWHHRLSNQTAENTQKQVISIQKKEIQTEKYGEVVVRNCMLENNDNTTLVDGIEIKVDGEDLIEKFDFIKTLKLFFFCQ